MQDRSTDFEFLPIDVSLGRCQRYFQFMGGTGGGFPMFQGYGLSGTDIRSPIIFPVKMRASPTATVNGTWYVSNSAQPAFDFISPEGCSMKLDVSGGSGETYSFPDGTDDFVTFNSEL